MTKHQYICAICDVVKEKSNCMKRKVGSVFVNKDYEILATGYNNPPVGFEHCDDGLTCGNPCSRNIHSEQNAIVQSAKRGVALRGSILYVSYTPCVTCARLLVNLGVQVVYAKEVNNDGGAEVLVRAGIPLLGWEEIGST